ncbi:MAG TPA: phosphatidylglycerol lysyltransferase domain-containing protein [Candidatus Acidoferrales bacterium]|nr:phosphatidylglycerol lysyltransferase domain-containing protein [Candidatus Acidoferrales bacterium]
MNRSFVRHALSLAVAALGLVDLASALLSRPPERLLALRHLVPTDVLDTSRTFTLLAGALLLLTANGLRRGKRRAFVVAMFFAALSVPVNLLKAFDFEEASVAAAMLFLLGINGEAFTVKSRAFTFRGMIGPLLMFTVGIAIYAVGGCWLVEWLFSPHEASLERAIAEAAYQMFGLGAPTLEVTRTQHAVRWFLGSISVIGITTLLGFVALSLRPARHRSRHRAEVARVRDLARRYGDSTVSAFASGHDTDHFFSANGRAVIAYHFESDTLLAIGDPIGPPEEMPALLESFERFCREHDWTFGFYQVRPEHLRWYRARGWNAVHIGEDPVLRTDRFTLEGSALGTVRRQVRKLEKAGYVVRHFVPGENPFDPDEDPDDLLEQIRAISNEWVREHPGGERGFCMGRFDPAELAQAWLSVACHPGGRRVEAFCTWTPIWARRGWAIDLMRRRHEAPTGTMELLVTRSVEHARERGDALMSLSLSALVKVQQTSGRPEDSLVTEDPARAFLIQRLSRFYDFQGLFRWKRKFNPEFEDRYLIYPHALALPRIALALMRAQSPGGLWSYLRRDEPPGRELGAGVGEPAATGDAA